jgi:hypothetical protein
MMPLWVLHVRTAKVIGDESVRIRAIHEHDIGLDRVNVSSSRSE